MGIEHVKAAYADWWHLPPGPFKLLAWMALRAVDRPTSAAPRAGVSYLGRDALARWGLGRDIPNAVPYDDPHYDEVARTRAAHHEAVKRAIRVLKEAGAITALNDPGPGARAEYQLNLSSTAELDDDESCAS